jgi:Ca2+-binding RTX toxin-like protein
LSHRNPLEALEPRTLLSLDLPTPPPTEFGVYGIGHTVYINGNAARDFIRILRAPASGTDQREGQIQVQINNTQSNFQPGNFKRVVIHGRAGDDIIRIDASLPPTFHPRKLVLHGDEGNDTITGSDRNDLIFGGDGNDLIVASTGVDEVRGGAGDDRIDGGYGNDRLFGDDGNDVLTGGPGADRIFGGAGDDVFHNAETDFERQQAAFRDLLDGGGGNDAAEIGPADRYKLITRRIPTSTT